MLIFCAPQFSRVRATENTPPMRRFCTFWDPHLYVTDDNFIKYKPLDKSTYNAILSSYWTVQISLGCYWSS